MKPMALVALTLSSPTLAPMNSNVTVWPGSPLEQHSGLEDACGEVRGTAHRIA